ncbi:hypothetical protein GTW69_11240, partial [Streptomyces sp. SID7760]|nr:hypothetical protein [Streptomyces sp. SID7760]
MRLLLLRVGEEDGQRDDVLDGTSGGGRLKGLVSPFGKSFGLAQKRHELGDLVHGPSGHGRLQQHPQAGGALSR